MKNVIQCVFCRNNEPINVSFTLWSPEPDILAIQIYPFNMDATTREFDRRKSAMGLEEMLEATATGRGLTVCPRGVGHREDEQQEGGHAPYVPG